MQAKDKIDATIKFNILLWDYEKSTAFTETQFEDTVHLNSSGAAQFSSLLNKQIDALLETAKLN